MILQKSGGALTWDGINRTRWKLIDVYTPETITEIEYKSYKPLNFRGYTH